ncbi:MAG: DUF262 domain-containing protein [Lachnospiraceae bacterium]|nr:DUF262 domain-containing protein [Lachnospiraceae bacterium]
MNGFAKPLMKFMDGADTRFIIPVYQRNYDWKLENCEQLFDDLFKVIEQERESHFFGSIVSIANTKGSSSELIIIDGQQRITTISLLLLALVNLLDEGVISSEQISLAEKIKNSYLIDPYLPDEKKVKLKPIKDDQDAFVKLFDSKDEYNHTSNVTRNYMYFYNRIKDKGELTPDELFRAIISLVIIDISLDPEKDDAQLIFESLNSTGLDLSEGDKIRNYILMGQSSDNQEKFYYNYWHKIEENTDYKVSEFIRHYLTAMMAKTPAIKDVYVSFKSYVEKNAISKEELLKTVLGYSKYYKQLMSASTSNANANNILTRLNILEMGVTVPYLLNLMDYREIKGLSDKEFEDVLETLEIYIFRRLICSVPTNALNKIFAMLHKECMRYKDENNSYSDVLKYVLNSKGASGRMPKNTEFIVCFEEKDMYNMKAKNKWYLFDRLENMNTVERTNVVSLMQDGTYTVEHIMPQKLSSHWKKDLGSNYQEVYDMWINRIANLTLTGYNANYSNRPFSEKLTVEDGFKDSHLQLNKFIAGCESWTEEEIKRRNDELKSKALKLWPYPKTDFQPVVSINETHSLDEEFNYKGKNLVSYTFMDTAYSSNNWTDMYTNVVKLLFELESSYIYSFVKSEDTSGLNGCFTDKKSDKYTEVTEQVYLWVHSNTMTKINNLRKLFEIYEIDCEELVFEIANDSE